ncbi:MAG TPA: chemotaxis protein CheW [Gemmatimonadaceae bacterium]|nr:chemotaxis protein CheW [Gemmatimonadaceae bacterium]
MTAPTDAAPATEMLLFRASGELFALALRAAIEVVEMPALEAVPDMAEGMLGVFAIRGSYVPVFAPEVALGVSPASGHAAVVMLRRGARAVGIALEDVEDVIMVDASRLHHPRAAAGRGVMVGVERRGGDLVGIVDADALVDACVARTGESE